MTRFSDHFVLPAGAHDAKLDGDEAKFLDPLRINRISDPDFDTADAQWRLGSFATYANSLVNVPNRQRELTKLLETPRELNQYHLGFSRGESRGNGTSAGMLICVFKLVKSVDGLDLSKHPEALLTLTPGMGPDHFNDYVSSITSLTFIRYTQRKCRQEGNPMKQGNRVLYFDPDTMTWKIGSFELPVFGGRAIILVPEAILVDSYPYTAAQYVQSAILPGRQAFYREQGKKKNRHDILALETADFTVDKYKTYAQQEVSRQPGRYLEFLEKYKLL